MRVLCSMQDVVARESFHRTTLPYQYNNIIYTSTMSNMLHVLDIKLYGEQTYSEKGLHSKEHSWPSTKFSLIVHCFAAKFLIIILWMTFPVDKNLSPLLE